MRALCATVLISRVAAAEPRVVIVETRDAPSLPGLAAQVQLHAGRPVSVGTLQERDAPSMTFATRASAIVNEQDATIVVWVAAVPGEDPAQRTLLVFAAGRWPGRALLELVRLDANTPASEVERTVALKISGLFDTMVTSRPANETFDVLPISVPRWRVELGGGFVAEKGDRGVDGRMLALVDHRWPVGDWTVAAGLAVYWQPSSTISAPSGLVSIDELGPIAAVAIERQLGAVTLFIRPQLLATFLRAEGNSTRARGSATVFSPGAGVDVGIRWRVSDRMEVVVAVGAEAAFTKQQFLVDGAEAADLRSGRVLLRVGLSVPLP